VAEHLYDGWVGAFDASQAVNSSPRAIGTPILFQRSGQITHLRYFHRVSTDVPPTHLRLYPVGDTLSFPGLIEEVALPNPGTATGWFEVALTAPIDVTIGETYLVVAHATSLWHLAFQNFNRNYPWTLVQSLTDYALASEVALTSAGQVASYGQFVVRGVDVVFEPVPFGDFTLAELEQEFEKWLTELGSRYPDSVLPNIYGQATGANENAQNAHVTAQQVQTDLGQFRDEWPGTLAASLQTGLNTIADWLNTEADWYQSLVEDTAPAVADLVESVGTYAGVPVLTYLADLIRWANGVYDRPQLADTDEWELLDETDFTNNLLWPVEADVYRVTLSAFDPAGTSEPVGTETRHGYLGKWCPFNVQFSSEWHYFNTSSADLYVGGRMPGLGLILYRPGAGHVQAWRRKEAV
jgi:hypothetical protein